MVIYRTSLNHFLSVPQCIFLLSPMKSWQRYKSTIDADLFGISKINVVFYDFCCKKYINPLKSTRYDDIFLWSLRLDHLKNHFFTTKNAMCKIGGTLHGRIINAEFYLQRASHNSHKNNQRQSWSQIREFWAMFVSY